MVNETTDKVAGDTNNSVPRVIERGSIILSSYSAYGTLYRATGSVVLNNVLASNNPIIECYYYTSGGDTQTLNKMNYNQSDSSSLPSINANFYLSTATYNSRTVIQINVEHIRTAQVSRTIYYVVYSSSFSEGVVF